MKKILIFSSFFPNEELDYMKTNSIGAISNANDSFQKSLIKGFSENGCEIEIVNLPNIGAYPYKFKKFFSKTFTFSMGEKIKGFNIGIININVIKHLHAYFKLRKKIKNLNHGDDYSSIIIYDLYPPFIKLIKDLKKNNTESNIVVIVPDIFGFTRDSTNIFHKILDYFNIIILKNNLIHADGFVYLTELMKLKMPPIASEKKSIVVEGLINPDNNLNKIQAKEVNKFILYTGSLDIRHGILNLVEAFLNANFSDISLVVCGDGEGRKEFEDKIRSHNNIKYLGQISRDKVLDLQSEAFLLVNPRTSEGEFTKYSFPSKVIEYFLSGTPTLMYRLQGIPTEYYDYCFSLEDKSIESLTEKLLEISKLDSRERIQMANDARDFIVNHKNCKIQTQRILDLLNDL